MSTVPEAIVARHMGVEVLGISCITNAAAGVLPQPLDHAEVMEVARQVRGAFAALLEGIIADSDDNGWTGDRRAVRAPDRRPAQRRDRRIVDEGRADGDRRAARKRRVGDGARDDRRNEAGWQPIALDAAVRRQLDDAALVAAAVDAREHARARFSGFKVGAALETATARSSPAATSRTRPTA